MRLKQEVRDEQKGEEEEEEEGTSEGRARAMQEEEGAQAWLYVHAPVGRGILASAIHLHRRLMVYMLH